MSEATGTRTAATSEGETVMSTEGPVTREVLEDRYDGAIYQASAECPDEWTELQGDISSGLMELVSTVARVHPDDGAGVVAELHDMIREHVIRRLFEGAAVRPS